jgi:uncharacterized beta-barrel protein YwiB (DUF1934 family)
MKYKITVKQKDITNNNEIVLFEGIVNNLNEFDYIEKNTNIRTTIYIDNDLFELIRYGNSRTLLHLEKNHSFAKVINDNGNIDLEVNLENIEILNDRYVYEYQIVQGNQIIQRFIFTLYYTVT